VQGTIVAVTNGTVNHTTQWVMTTSGTVTVGTTAINWSDGALYGTANKVVVTQAVDASRVYVGGSRCTDSTFRSWGIVCFDIVTGQKLWDYDIGGDCRKILIDPSGNVVCMVDIGSANYVITTTTLYTQQFIVLSPTGTLINSPSFTQVHSPAQGSTVAVRTLDFCINEDGDYHVLAYAANPSGSWPYYLYYTEIYEWMSPQTGAPTLREFLDYISPTSINRIGGRDYIGTRGNIIYPTGQTKPTFSMGRSKSQQAAPHSTADYDFRVPDIFYDNSLFPTTDVATIAAAGTTQGTATALVANKNYLAVTGTAGAGFRLPTGSTGDVIGCDKQTAGTGSHWNYYYFYPPTGGIIDFDSSITRHLGSQGSVFICTSPGNWSSCGLSPIAYSSLSYWGVQAIAVDSAGSFRTIRSFPYPCEISYSSTGVPQYVLPVSTNTPFPQWICSDSSNNTYYLGVRSSSAASVVARDSSGAFKWGHKHSGTKAIIANAYATHGGVYQTPSGYCPIQMDPDGTAVIVSGYDDSNGIAGPNNVVNDLNFVSDPG
jgi:hypothetical protein